MIIAIDGPSGAGKGTLARFLSHTFNLCHIDSGALYRYAALIAEKEGISTGSDAHAIRSILPHVIKVVESLTLDDIQSPNPNIRLETTASLASSLAAYPEMRHAVSEWMHRSIDLWDLSPSKKHQGFVIDGRDITTVVCPNAPVKIYLMADEDARAQRRVSETGESSKTVTQTMKERDYRDTHRVHAPLTIGEDVFVIDTTHLSIDAVCQLSAQYVVKCLPHMASFYER